MLSPIANGIVENQWTLGTKGPQEVNVYLKDANKKIIKNSLLSFTAAISQAVKPIIHTSQITSITQTTAIGGGNITSDNGALPLPLAGVCWNTTGNPTINDSKTSNGSGTGSFTSELDYLESNTTYYVRAYAANSAGTAYGEQVSFTTTKSISLPTLLAGLTITGTNVCKREKLNR